MLKFGGLDDSDQTHVRIFQFIDSWAGKSRQRWLINAVINNVCSHLSTYFIELKHFLLADERKNTIGQFHDISHDIFAVVHHDLSDFTLIMHTGLPIQCYGKF